MEFESKFPRSGVGRVCYGWSRRRSDMRSDVDVLLRSSAQTSDSIAGIEERLNDAEDRLRRCNLVFYGISEGESESWSESEKLVTDICNTNLKMALEPKDIHRAHRIGKIAREKNAPFLLISLLLRLKMIFFLRPSSSRAQQSVSLRISVPPLVQCIASSFVSPENRRFLSSYATKN